MTNKKKPINWYRDTGMRALGLAVLAVVGIVIMPLTAPVVGDAFVKLVRVGFVLIFFVLSMIGGMSLLTWRRLQKEASSGA